MSPMRKTSIRTLAGRLKKWLGRQDIVSLLPLRDLPASEKPTAFALKISAWKRDFIAQAYPEYNWVFLNFKKPFKKYEALIRSVRDPVLFIWGAHDKGDVMDFVRDHAIPLCRIEDGFVRSLGLGADHNLPLSLVVDRSGVLFFDPSAPSDLESLIAKAAYTEDERDEAKALIQKLIDSKISKYNATSLNSCHDFYDSYGEKAPGRKRILVIGQVEDDASILKGGCGFDNGKLVWLAREQNPDAQIFFKVHPDVLAGKREIKTPLKEIENIAHIIREPLPLDIALTSIDEVYTISSLSGFEALLRGHHVVVAGQPFYAGYGLTQDLHPIERRAQALPPDMARDDKLAHLFRAAYMAYPDYFNIYTGERITLSQAMDILTIGHRVRDEREHHLAS